MRKLLSVLSLLLLLSFLSYSQNAAEKSAPKAQSNAPVIKNLNVIAYDLLIQNKKDIQIVDVRTPEEYKGGHLKHAMNMDFRSTDFKTLIGTLDKSKPTFIYCLSGGRSSSAAIMMAEMGFREIYNMEGGMMKWNAAGKSVESANDAAVEPGMSPEDFKKSLSPDKYTLVDYNATWCAPCKKMLPVLQSLANEKKDKMILLLIDADKNKNLLKSKGIDAIPYLELYKNGNLLWKHNGYIEKQQLLDETKL